jgi:two-component system NtrC family response regulator/two-component system response regulator HydG
VVSKARVVLVDDDDGSRAAMATGLRRVGYEVADFDAGEPALAALERGEQADVVITDVRMPGMDGYEVVRRARALRPEIAILMVTAFGDVDGAVQALQGGADDFLTKPVELPVLRKRVEQQLERRNLTRDKRELQERLESFVGFENIIGRSPAMQQVLERVRVVAPAPTTVLIVGESGSGKELIANAIHEHSPRAARRFVALNCGAIPGEILEAELFGHERGAFTGAHQRRVGKLEAADGGTFFLDEISELSADLQVKLLRVLEERRIVRVGGNDEIPVDFRLVAATNRDLDGEVASGRFRQELYYRLKVVTLSLPPLRARGEDIPLLVAHFIARFNAQLDRNVVRVAPELLASLRSYPWPGNVRELRNVVENMVLFCRGEELTLADLPPEHREGRPVEVREAPGEWAPRPMAEIEREAILRTLDLTGGHRAKAAQLLGIGLRTLQRKLKEYGAAAVGEEVEE